MSRDKSPPAPKKTGIFETYENHVYKMIENVVVKYVLKDKVVVKTDSFNYIQEVGLASAIIVLCTVGIPVLLLSLATIFSLPDMYHIALPPFILIYIIMWAGVAGFIPYKARAIICIAMFFMYGVIDIGFFGPISCGSAWMSCCALLATYFLGPRFGYAVLGIIFMFYTLTTVLCAFDLLPWILYPEFQILHFVTSRSTSLILSITLVFSFTFIRKKHLMNIEQLEIQNNRITAEKIKMSIAYKELERINKENELIKNELIKKNTTLVDAIGELDNKYKDLLHAKNEAFDEECTTLRVS